MGVEAETGWGEVTELAGSLGRGLSVGGSQARASLQTPGAVFRMVMLSDSTFKGIHIAKGIGAISGLFPAVRRICSHLLPNFFPLRQHILNRPALNCEAKSLRESPKAPCVCVQSFSTPGELAVYHPVWRFFLVGLLLGVGTEIPSWDLAGRVWPASSSGRW